jgi:hypothetical protein
MTRSLAIFFIFIGIVASSTADRRLEEAMTIWSKPQYSGPERIWLRKQAVLFSEIFKTMPGLDASQRTLSLSSFIQFITSAIRELDRRQTYRLAVALEEVRHRRDSRKSVKGICRAAIRAEFDGSIVMTPEGASRVWDFDYDSLIIDLYLNILEEVPEIDLLSFQGLLRDPIRQNALRVALRIVTQNTDLFSDQWKEQLSCLSEISTPVLVGWADVLTLVQETTDRLSVQYQVDMGIVYVPLWMTRVFIEYPTRLRLLAEGMIQLSRVPEFNEISASLARAFASPESMNLILSTCLPTKYKTKIYYYAGGCEIYFLRHRVREFITDLILNRVPIHSGGKPHTSDSFDL